MQGGTKIAGLSPIVIPVFVSNLGCPNRCVFCDQRQNAEPIEPGDVASYVDEFIARCRYPRDRQRIVAYYGGSFTGIDEGLLAGYLHVTRDLISRGCIHAAKASTRPDMVSAEVLDTMRMSGFVELEIGVQSMDDDVLEASGRGHTSDDARQACSLVKESGMKLGIQIMPGLPGEDVPSLKKTLDEVVSIGPDNARIYPTVVLEGTPLERMYRRGDYRPLTLDEAIRRSLYACIRLEHAGSSILRIGIPSSQGLRITAGPFHESFGFLVRARGYRMMAQRLVSSPAGFTDLKVNSTAVTELIGYRRDTLQDLKFSFSFDDTLPRGYIRAYAARESACIQLQDILEYIL